MDEEQKSMERRMVLRVLRHWREAAAEREMPARADVLRVLQHWRDAAAERDMPAKTDIDPEVMADVWGECFVVDVSHPDDPVITSVGKAFRDLCGEDFSGCALSAVPKNTLMAAACTYHARVLSKKVPLSVGGQMTQNNGHQLLYRSILLPLSDDGVKINYLLGAANCRIMTKD